MLSGLMMDYPLTIDRVLEHGNRLYPYKQIRTKLPGGGLHTYTYRDLYGRVKRLCNLLDGPGRRAGAIASAPSPGTTTSTSNSTSARRARARSCTRSTFASFPSSWPLSSTTPRTK